MQLIRIDRLCRFSANFYEKDHNKGTVSGVRGQGNRATGIAYNTHGSLKICKAPVRAKEFRFALPTDSKVIIDYTRMTTKGNWQINHNNYPFYGNAGSHKFALAHNGVLNNDEQLRNTLKLPDNTFETDSFIAVQLIESRGKVDFEFLKYMSEQVSGSFCFSVLTANRRK